MPQDKTSMQKLYDAMNGAYNVKTPYDEFASGMADSTKRQKVYDAMSSAYTMKDDFSTFSGKLLGEVDDSIAESVAERPSPVSAEQYVGTVIGAMKKGGLTAGIDIALKLGGAIQDVIDGEGEIGEPLKRAANNLWVTSQTVIPSTVQAVATAVAQTLGDAIDPNNPYGGTMGLGMGMPGGLGSQASDAVFQLMDPIRKDWAEYKRFEANVMNPAEPATGRYARGPKKWTDWVDPQRIAMTIAEQGPQMAALMGAYLANPVLGTILMGAVETDDTFAAMDNYEKETGELIDPRLKQVAPAVVGSLNAMLEKLGFTEMLKVGKTPGVRGMLMRGVLAWLTEGTTEGLQQLSQEGALGLAGKKLNWDTVLQSIYGGLVLGFGGSIISGAAGSVTQVNEEDIKAFLNKAMSPSELAVAEAHAVRNSPRGKEAVLERLLEMEKEG